jgi:peptidoglycan/LPS O-acetylase OafA/YrhL
MVSVRLDSLRGIEKHDQLKLPPGEVFLRRPISGERVAAARLSYRPDIQILRAVAVVLVVLFHLRTPGFGSGFLGVDVFFVISGYLMETLYGHGVSAAEFYRRRARRLLPAYFAAILAVLTASAFITLPAEFGDVAQQSLFASALSSNFGFWLQTSYFESTQFRPLLHLWSLGVEAQFYLCFPLLVRLDRRWLSATAIASLVTCLAVVAVSPKTSFFMMPFRAWEFAVGMLAARSAITCDRRLGLAALIGVLLCVVIPVNGQTRSLLTGHPALPALAVSLLTAATLIHRLPSKLEGSALGRAAQRVGDVSYSLYLVHFPIIVLLNYAPFSGTQLGLTRWTVPLIAAATSALFFGFERNGPRLFSIRSAAAAAACIWLLAFGLPKAQLLRFNHRDRLIFAGLDDRAVYRCGKLFRILHPTARFCPLGHGEPVLLVGDSHADAIKESFAKVAEAHGFNVYLTVANDPLRSSALTVSELRNQLNSLNARWAFVHFSAANLTPALLDKAWQALGSRMVLVGPTPIFNESVPEALYERHQPRARAPNPLIRQWLAAHHVPLIDARSALCSPVCRVQDDQGRPLYFDNSHQTLTGARLLDPLFNDWFDRAAHLRPAQSAS